MSGRPIARRTRTPLASRRTRPVRRASAQLSAVRAGAALAMLVSAAAIYGVGASPAFDYTKLQVDGLHVTDPAAVEVALADARGENLFRLATRPSRRRWRPCRPSRARASTSACRGRLRSRSMSAIRCSSGRSASGATADAGGTLFALITDAPPAAATDLVVVDDRRATSADLSVGLRLDPVDLDAATRLASLGPADVGSSAVSLAVAVTDENGFVVSARPDGWSAVFGFYTPSLRTTALVPGQVRLLRSLLMGREQLVERVILASETDGTYVPRGTPSAIPSAKPEPAKVP